MKEKYKISDLSKYLFWDVDTANVTWQDSSIHIIEKVLKFGQMKDWKIIKEIYGFEKIKEVSLQIRSLDKVTLSFVSTLFKINKEKFRCYTQAQLYPTLWNS